MNVLHNGDLKNFEAMSLKDDELSGRPSDVEWIEHNAYNNHLQKIRKTKKMNGFRMN